MTAQTNLLFECLYLSAQYLPLYMEPSKSQADQLKNFFCFVLKGESMMGHHIGLHQKHPDKSQLQASHSIYTHNFFFYMWRFMLTIPLMQEKQNQIQMTN